MEVISGFLGDYVIFNRSYLVLVYTIQLMVFLGFWELYAVKWCDLGVEWFLVSIRSFWYIAYWIWLGMLVDCIFWILGLNFLLFCTRLIEYTDFIRCAEPAPKYASKPWFGRSNSFGLPIELSVWQDPSSVNRPNSACHDSELVWSTNPFRCRSRPEVVLGAFLDGF